MPPSQQTLRPKLLLAKSKEKPWKGAYTLTGHTASVVEAVTTLIDELGHGLIHQFGLSQSLERLRATARLAAFLHDLGKANDHFQAVVRKLKNPMEHPQLMRHEALSVLLAWEIRDWLSTGKGDLQVAIAAAGGHHLKLGGEGGKQTDEVGTIRKSGVDDWTRGDRILLYTNHKHFIGLLRYGQKACGLDATLPTHLPTTWTLADLKQQRQTLLREFVCWDADPVFTAVVKALLVAGDTSGSALPANDVAIRGWIEQQIRYTLTEAELQHVVDERLQGNTLRPFQSKLGHSEARVTLARAGCGTGKTLGAYNWAKRHAVGRKLFFCYPTTGTSTEGFLDYAHEKVDSTLLHTRAAVDLEHLNLHATGDDDDLETKLESFKAWSTKVSVCTVDTVLGLLQCNRRPMYCFPAIAQAAFVFDEVHCYDDKLFGALLRFLEVVKAPVLLMSASFLPWQLQAIEKAVGVSVEVIHGPKDLETQPRYCFHYADAPDWERVKAEFEAGGKILWVCNQVNTAIGVYQDAQKLGLRPLLYHSRYKYCDRVQHHREVVDRFKAEGAVMAIATQVAEMSLDLSASLLVSQIADPAGLIQRLGRLNRQYCGYALDALFYPDGKVGFPYKQEELDSGLALIQSFSGEVCQADLAQWLEQAAAQGEPDMGSVWLDGEWRTYPASLREAGYTTTVLLEQDTPTVEKLPAKLIPRYTVPLVVSHKRTKGWKKCRRYPVAPVESWGYSSEIGAYELKRK
ncbi:CRISPR-associated helicase Cas3' [Synechococcales cyanobacterium C]|uniref:CRISPR-associated helicase Cas3 n=1 Tax=Petrachloros mirabilis ULC683 TaxID=2781853 RepID=A0A8K1ZY12_9CYAN|nr:CRISPR-associated helicase Cas3' [Petrachloros mirabilis]NCJ06222.1 CRISPR-associated helicase Cas3' [Petrachloros mirabilis ULC683]